MVGLDEEAKQARTGPATALIGFLTVEKTTDGAGFLGALMVTDERGYPLEFRCTTPVRPTAVQTVLYGERLEPFVSVELCGKRLLAEVQRKPRLVVVPFSYLLALDDGHPPIFAVQRAGEVFALDSAAKDINLERAESSSGRFQPVVVIRRIDREQDAAARALLLEVFSRFDLVEPFDRIRKALKILGEQDPKYR